MKLNSFNKTTGKLALTTAFCSAILMAGYATDAKAADVEVPVTAKITSSIEQTKAQDLRFGTIDVIGAAAIVVDAKAGAANSAVDGGGTNAIIEASTSGSGQITVTSPSALEFSIAITYPTTAVTLTEAGGTGTLSVTEIGTNSTASPVAHSGGTSDIHIGGKLTIPAGTTAGDYAGTMTVTLEYS